MFGIFKKKFRVSCEMCGALYEIKIKKSAIEKFDFDYHKFNNWQKIDKQKCNFCRTNITFVYRKNGTVICLDDKWEMISSAHNEKLESIDDQLDELEDERDENPNDKKIEAAINKLEIKKEKLEDSFEIKEEKYADRQSNWGDKYMDKMERMDK